MPSTWALPWLWESLADAGVDSPPAILQFGDIALPTVVVQDLRYTMRPALHARAWINPDVAAFAGLFSGFEVQAQPSGFWLLSVSCPSTSNVNIGVRNSAVLTANLANAAWNIFGNDPQETIATTTDFFAVSRAGSAPVALSTASMRLVGGTVYSGLPLMQPAWIPGNAWLCIVGNTVNSSILANLDVQLPAGNTGRFT